MVTLQRASVEHGKKCRAVEGRKTHRRRAAESPCGRAQARQPRTTFYPLFPPPLKKSTGRPLSTAKIAVRLEGRAGFTHRQRAAESPCGRAQAPTTHYFLLPPLYSLLAPFVSIRGSKMFFVFFVVFVVSFLPPQATRGGIAVRARPSAPTTHYLLLPTLSSLLMLF